MKRDTAKKEYTDQFISCQKQLKDLLARPPVGIQNWSYQKSVNFKKTGKEMRASTKAFAKIIAY